MIAQVDVLTRADVPAEETWDLTPIYPDDAAWEADARGLRALITAAAAHRGRLEQSSAALRQALDDAMAVRQAVERLTVYATLRRDEDTADPEALARYERAMALAVEAGEALAFLQPEILAIAPDRLAAFHLDPALAPYHHLLDDIARHRPYTRSVEVEEVLAQGADVARAASDVFNALDNADLDFGTVRDETGAKIALTKARYQLLLESKDREVRRAAYETLMGAYRAHQHTLAALHAASVRKDVFYAHVRGFASARQAALFGDNIPESVYDSLIAAVREARPVIERYLALRQRLLRLDRLAIYDLYVPLAPRPDRRYAVREAVDLVLDALTPLGDQYVRDLGDRFAARMVDWHETKGKRSGAYSWGAYGAPPVILMNWNGTIDHVFTLAHEAGHAMHSYYADAAQPFHQAQYPIFLAEVASTVNEVLLTWSLLAKAPAGDAMTRFAILNRFADVIQTTLLRQTMLAEFEQRTHAMAEAGEPLTLKALTALHGELQEAYLPGVVNDEAARLGWSRVPHFYRAFYVYQYATGISAAVTLARAIRAEGEPARERYLALLRAGGSDYPLPLLQRAGVDLTTPEPVRTALAEFDATVAEMERLADAAGFAIGDDRAAPAQGAVGGM